MEFNRELLGQLICCGFHGPTLDQETKTFFQKIKPGGVILFKRNIESLDQLSQLCFSLHNLYEPPPFIAIDQEGGIVNRLFPILPETPDAFSLGTHGNLEMVETLGTLTGQALRAIGIDVDFAPVLDMSSPDSQNGIGKRSYSVDTETVINMGGASLRGLLGEGVAGTLKHFPGLGASTIDSHDSLPTIEKNKTFLELQDMKPFEILSPITPFIMIGHGYYPYLTTERTPATLSSIIIRDILRKDLSFNGIIITDDMEMGALKTFVSSGEEAVMALEAGCDIVLYCSSMEMIKNAYENISSSLEKQILNEAEIQASLQRIFEVKRSFIVKEKSENIDAKIEEITEKMRTISDNILSSL